jgi:outer membrane lipoprotein-sorting protein
LAVAALAIGGGYDGARMLAPRTPGAPAAPAPATTVVASSAAAGASTAAGGDGEQLIRRMVETLERRPNIAARLRQSLHVGNERLTGEGEYWQQGRGNQRRTRWDAETLIAGDKSFVTQVFDGDHVWTDRRRPGMRKITRVDVDRVQRELAAQPSAPDVTQLASGGLVQLGAELKRCYAWGTPQALKSGQQTLLAVVGQWRPDELQRLWPGLSPADTPSWPAHLPHHVLTYIDADTLFPCVIEYRGGAQSDLATSPGGYYLARDPLARYEFIDVEFAAAMPANLFQFSPGEVDWQDVTARLVEQLRPAAPAEVSASRRQSDWR